MFEECPICKSAKEVIHNKVFIALLFIQYVLYGFLYNYLLFRGFVDTFPE